MSESSRTREAMSSGPQGIRIRELSLAIEEETGFDSIPTIERVYLTNDNGNFMCVFPDCSVVRESAEAMWRHVHLSRKHGPTKEVVARMHRAMVTGEISNAG